MIHEFQELAAATDAIRDLIQQADGDCLVEVMMTHSGQCLHRPQSVSIEALKPILNNWLRDFPRSLVRYTVDSRHVLSASIWCHCTKPERRRCPIGKTCPGAPNSPKATIIVTSIKGEETLLGSWKSPKSQS